jgi:hypothetical protein
VNARWSREKISGESRQNPHNYLEVFSEIYRMSACLVLVHVMSWLSSARETDRCRDPPRDESNIRERHTACHGWQVGMDSVERLVETDTLSPVQQPAVETVLQVFLLKEDLDHGEEESSEEGRQEDDQEGRQEEVSEGDRCEEDVIWVPGTDVPASVRCFIL